LKASTLIYQKLERFINKYYWNEILKGTILFLGFGLIYLLFTLFVEYFLWLKPNYRAVLFFSFLLVELALILRFIAYPFFKLFKLKKGIDDVQASKIIGQHFNEIDDKLLNFLQLDSNSNSSDLLLASIEQKAQSLEPFPFQNAVNLKENRKYIPLAILPILFFAFFYLSGNKEIITDSFGRVVQFDKTFIPPAPFQFKILNRDLTVNEGDDFSLVVNTVGKVKPASVVVVFSGQEYFMTLQNDGSFVYNFSSLSKPITFVLKGNDVSSQDFRIDVVPVPTIQDIQLVLDYPPHTNKKRDFISGTGNAEIPEGTRVTWNIATKSVERLFYIDFVSKFPFIQNEASFSFSKSFSNSVDYKLEVSNMISDNNSVLDYNLLVVKDQYPVIEVKELNNDGDFVYVGQLSDDYGLRSLNFVYFEETSPQMVKKFPLDVQKDKVGQFVFTIPKEKLFDKGKSYNFHFEVTDNDAINNFKTSKSTSFNQKVKTDNEESESLLNAKNAAIKSLEKSLKNNEKQNSSFDELKRLDKEKSELNFKEQQKIQSVLEKQKESVKQMKEFSKELQKNLEKFSKDKNDDLKEELLDRFKKNQDKLQENQDLLDELERLNEKLQKEELFDKMEEMNKNSKTSKKNLEQLLELTKKYYVEKKLKQLVDKLESLSDKQDKLAEKTETDEAEKQDKLNNDFKDLKDQFRDLEKENDNLKSPLELPTNKAEEQSIDKEMEKSSDDLKDNKPKDANKPQKNAAKKMKELAQSMSQAMAMSGAQKMEEDIKTLRQILDNLLAFSFSQEDVMKSFSTMRNGAPNFNKNLKLQQNLRLQFKHIDDSLFALSLRNEKISDFVNEESGNIYYNIDRSLESFVDNNLPKGVSHQQYVSTSANKLADFLSNLLNQMQMSMNASGGGTGSPKPGQGKGAQLPDIIQKQQGLADKMKGKNKGDKKGEGEEGNEGEEGQGKEGAAKGHSKSKGDGSEGSGTGDSNGNGEENAKLLMEIFKEQRDLRKQLENQLSKSGLSPDGKKVLDQMKDVEKSILNKGFNNEVLNKMLDIKYNMLKLSDAIQQQEEDSKRSSNSNKNEFIQSDKSYSKEIQEYIKSIEILNRQVLPLQPEYSKIVKQYFNLND
jgi:hypothetical protein